MFFFFRFCNGERVSIGNISRGKVGQPRRNGSRATFQPANSTETSDGPRMIRDD